MVWLTALAMAIVSSALLGFAAAAAKGSIELDGNQRGGHGFPLDFPPALRDAVNQLVATSNRSVVSANDVPEERYSSTAVVQPQSQIARLMRHESTDELSAADLLEHEHADEDETVDPRSLLASRGNPDPVDWHHVEWRDGEWLTDGDNNYMGTNNGRRRCRCDHRRRRGVYYEENGKATGLLFKSNAPCNKNAAQMARQKDDPAQYKCAAEVGMCDSQGYDPDCTDANEIYADPYRRRRGVQTKANRRRNYCHLHGVPIECWSDNCDGDLGGQSSGAQGGGDGDGGQSSGAQGGGYDGDGQFSEAHNGGYGDGGQSSGTHDGGYDSGGQFSEAHNC